MANTNAGNEPGRIRQLTGPWTDWHRKRFWALSAFLVYSLLGFYAAPPLIHWLAVSQFDGTGRTATLEAVRVNPWTLTITAENAEVRDTDGDVILAYDEYFWNFQASSAFRRAWTFKRIHLYGLYMHEERFSEVDTRYSRLIDAFSGDMPRGTDSGGGIPRIIIGHFEMANGQVTLTDQVAGGFKATFGPINVELHDLRTIPDHSGQQSVSIRTAAGGLIEWRGTLQTVPFASEGSLSIEGESLSDFFRYAEHYLPFKMRGDRAAVSLDYRTGMRDGELFLAAENLQARFEGSRLTPDGASESILSLDSISLADGALNWPEQTARATSLDIEGLDLRAGLTDTGDLDLLALVPEFPPGDATAEPGEPWIIELDTLRVPGATLRLSDGTLSPAMTLDLLDTQLELTGVDNRDGTVMPLSLATRLSSGGDVRYDGEVSVFPDVQTQGRLSLAALQLPVAQRYLEPFLRIELRNGALDLAGDLTHGPDQLAALSGELTISDFEVQDTRQQERLLSWDRLQLDRFEADLAAHSLVSSELVFDGLFGRLHIAEDLSTNVADLVVASDDAGSDSDMPALQVGGISLVNGALDFSDFSLPLPFEAAIRELNGDISTLSTSSSEPSSVNFEGQVNEYGQARIGGDLNPWAPTDLARIDMTFRNLDLSRLTPYTIQFAGYEIDDGRMDLDLGYRLEQRQMQGENSIIIRDIQLGEKVDHPDAGSLPLGLAVALLTDTEGVIDLDVPVEGDLDDPEFKIGGVVWRAIGNLLTKAVTAPFRLLGSLVGIESEDFGTLQFAAGRSDVSPPDREQLLKLGEAMVQRPELTVTVGGVFDRQADSAALAEQAAESLISARSEALPIADDELSTDHDRRVLESLLSETSPGIDLAALQAEHTPVVAEGETAELDLPAYVAALRNALVAAQSIDTAQLETLAMARSESVLAALLEANPDTSLKAVPGETVEVEAEDPLSIPLELGVSAGD